MKQKYTYSDPSLNRLPWVIAVWFIAAMLIGVAWHPVNDFLHIGYMVAVVMSLPFF